VTTVYEVTEQDIQILGSKIKQYKTKLELLNSQLQTIDTIQGDCLSCSYNCDSTSDIRRTCAVKVFIKDKTYNLDENSKFWFNRFLKIYIGLKTISSNGFIYYPLGLFTYSESDYTWDSSNRTLDLKAVDFVWYLTQTKIGGAETTKIPNGNIIRNALISIVTQLGGFSKYNIVDIHNIKDSTMNTVPYDIEVNAGTTVWELITKLRDLYIGYECFCDMDMFITRQIPTMIEDPVVLDYETIIKKQLVLSENMKVDFNTVRNVTEIFGSTIDVDGYTNTCTNSGSAYSCIIDSVTELYDGLKVAVKLNVANSVSPTLNVSNLGAHAIVNSDGTVLAAGEISDYTAFEYKNEQWIVLGKYQVHSVCILRNTEPSDIEKAQDKTIYNTDSIIYRIMPDSQFAIEKIGIRKDVKTGSDYENIYSNDLCEQRAQYENWKSTRLNRVLELGIQTIPFADVNQKFTYKLLSTGEIKTFITTKISSDDLTKGTETIEATEFFETYPNGASY